MFHMLARPAGLICPDPCPSTPSGYGLIRGLVTNDSFSKDSSSIWCENDYSVAPDRFGASTISICKYQTCLIWSHASSGSPAIANEQEQAGRLSNCMLCVLQREAQKLRLYHLLSQDFAHISFSPLLFFWCKTQTWARTASWRIDWPPYLFFYWSCIRVSVKICFCVIATVQSYYKWQKCVHLGDCTVKSFNCSCVYGLPRV